MAHSAPIAPSNDNIAPLNFVYACSVCCAIVADAYDGHDETVEGLSDGINPKDRVVTRTYLASCCHVVCGKHLEGGGPPFHPAGQRPQAVCPVCVKDSGDATPRDLFSIRGFHEDEYDPSIPPVWFTTPPISLDGKGKEMEALRFQYLALVRYCQKTYAARKSTSAALSGARRQLAAMQKLASEEHAKIVSLQQENQQLHAIKEQINELASLRAEVQRLQGLEQEVGQARADIDSVRRLEFDLRELETFKQNKPAIKHYLKLVPSLIEQNQMMKERLASLGFAMALEPIPKSPKLSPDVFDEPVESKENHPVKNRWFRAPNLTRTTGRPSNDTVEQMHDSQGRPTKRQRVDSPFHRNLQTNQSSRDDMPPPSKPLSHITSMRKIIPTLRKKLSNNRSMPTPHQASRHDNDAEMSEDGDFGGATTSQLRERAHHVPTQSGMRQNKPLISRATPTQPEYGLADPRESILLRSVGISENKSDFTFRATSPVTTDTQMNRYQPLQLPKEPSYMRIMDGLSPDDELEIGLRDPREDVNGQVTYTTGNDSETLERGQPWSLRHVPSSRSGGRNTGQQHYVRKDGLITPTTRRLPHPAPPVESVVSPFFRASHLDTRVFSGTGVAEPRHSSNLSNNYQSPSVQARKTTSQWREPIGSNGLSFLQSPVVLENEPLQHTNAERMSDLSQHTQRGNLTSKGFFARPEIKQRPYMGNHTQDPSFTRLPVSYRHPIQPQSAVQFSSFVSNSSPRARQLSSAVPPIISGRFPTGGGPSRHLGVKSSRQTHTAGQAASRLGSRISCSSSRRIIKR